MKTILHLVILLLLTTNAFSGEYSREYLEQQLGKFKTMRTTGIILTTAGIPMAAVGIPMYFSEYGKQYSDDINTGKFLGGAVLMVAGELMIIGGVVLWAFGHSRVKRYKKMISRQDFGLNFEVTKKGLSLQYRF